MAAGLVVRVGCQLLCLRSFYQLKASAWLR
jgi:hypothetical protein